MFSQRLLFHGLLALGTIVLALAIGMAGYMGFEGMEFIDAFVNSAMILSGMGPMDELQHEEPRFLPGSMRYVCGLLLFAVAGLFWRRYFTVSSMISMWMMMTRIIKIAAAQYPLDELKDLASL